MFDQHQGAGAECLNQPFLERVFYNFLTSSGLRWAYFTLIAKDSH